MKSDEELDCKRRSSSSYTSRTCARTASSVSTRNKKPSLERKGRTRNDQRLANVDPAHPPFLARLLVTQVAHARLVARARELVQRLERLEV